MASPTKTKKSKASKSARSKRGRKWNARGSKKGNVFHQRLGSLTHHQACALLGEEGRRLIADGGRPDFRTNRLGTCKHILHVQEKVRKRFSAAKLRAPYVRKRLSLRLD